MPDCLASHRPAVGAPARRRAGWRRALTAAVLHLVLLLLAGPLAAGLALAEPAEEQATVERARHLALTAPPQAEPLLRSLGDPAALPSDALRGRYYEARGTARANLQQLAAALEDFQAALKYASVAGDDRTAGLARLGIAWVTEVAHGFAAAQPLYEAALKHARATGDRLNEALVHAVRARGAAVFDQVEVALQSVRAAQSIAATVTLDPGTRSNVAFSAAWVARRAGDSDAARSHFEEALAAAREFGDRSAEGDIAIALADLEHELGHHDKALRLAELARADYAALEDESAVAVADVRASANLLALGRAGEALARARAAAGRLTQGGNPVMAWQALLALAAAEIDLRQAAAALRTLGRARQLLDSGTPAGAQASFHRLWARASAGVGDYSGAFAALEESLQWQRQDTALTLSSRTAAQRALLDYERLARQNAALEQRAAADAAQLAAGQERTVMLAALLVALVSLVGALVYGVVRQRRLHRRVAVLAATDHLTGIPNRRRIDEAGAAMVAARRRVDLPLAVIEVDIDDFKAINDRHGHATGDAVLQAVAATLRVQLRDADHVGRYGGDEFLVLLPGLAEKEAAAVAERLRAAVQALDLRSGGSAVPLTVSVGVAGTRAEDREYEQVVRRADAALYEAKARGRNCVAVASPPAPAPAPAAGEQAA